jgi:hypothetical protein
MSSIIFMSFRVDAMVTFSAALLQTRQTAVSLHLFSSLVHSLRLLACLLAACSLASFLECCASPRRCLLDVLRIHNIHAVPHNNFHLFPCHLRIHFSSSTDVRERSSQLFSSLVHSLRLLACLLLARLLPSLNACRFSTSLSPRCSNFASAIQTFTRFPIITSISSRVIARSYSLLVVYRCAGKKFTVDATLSQRA